MRNVKKVLAVFLAVLFVLSGLGVGMTASAEAAVMFTVVPNVTTAHPGDTITYSVYMDPVTDMDGLQLKLGLPDGLTFGQADTNTNLLNAMAATCPEFGISFYESSLTLFIFTISTSEHFTSKENDVLLTFTCTVDSDASGEKTIDLPTHVITSRAVGGSIPTEYDSTDSVVTVKPAAPTKAINLVSGKADHIKGAQTSSVWFGNYMQSSADSKEPVKWRVLSNADGKLFLLSDQNLDVVQYNEKFIPITWADCTLRKWLNGYENHPYNDTFVGSAFSEKELTAVADSAVESAKNPQHPAVNSGDDTTDKVFLLSIAEATNTDYGFTDNYDPTDTRVSTNTGYVASGGHTGRGDMYGVGEDDYWWLRSPGFDAYHAAFVYNVGDLDLDGSNVRSDNVAVRPAFKMNLSKVLFTSAAENGKTGDGLTAVSDYTGSDWKLTVKDESRSGFRARCTAIENGVYTIAYSGASTGENEKISAIIVDADGVVTYYGVLENAKAGENTLTLDVSGKMNDGDKLYVFNEQYNGDKKTDYASALVDVTERSILSYDLWVGDTEVTEECTSGEGWEYAPATNTLTLNNYQYEGEGHSLPDGKYVYSADTSRAAIVYSGSEPLNLVLEGDNAVKQTGGDLRTSAGLFSEGALTISGTGTLTAEAGEATLDVESETTYTSGVFIREKLTVTGGTVTGRGGTGTLSHNTWGIYAKGFELSGGEVYAYGGSVTGTGRSIGLQSDGAVTVSGGKLTCRGGKSTGHSDGLRTGSNMTVTGGSVDVSSGDGSKYSYGIEGARRGDVLYIGASVDSFVSVGICEAVDSSYLTVKNELPGKGWKTVDATDDAIAIAVNPDPGAGLYMYKKVEFKQFKKYDLWVGGVQFDEDNLEINANDIPGVTGSATYDPENNELTLDGFQYTGEGYRYLVDPGTQNEQYYAAGIYYTGTDELTVRLVQENAVTVTGDATNSYGFRSENLRTAVTFTGTGSLTARGADNAQSISYGITVSGSLCVEKQATVTGVGGDSSKSSYGVTTYVLHTKLEVYGTLTGNGGSASNISCGVYGAEITVGTDAVLTAAGSAGDSSRGIIADSVTVRSGTVEAASGEGERYSLAFSPHINNIAFDLSDDLTMRAGESKDKNETVTGDGWKNQKYVLIEVFHYKVGDTLQYGTYPQSEVKDAATVAALNAKLRSNGWISYGYYIGTGGYNGEMAPDDFMRYQDVVLDGVKYRAVTFDRYRPMNTAYTSSADNSYQDENSYEPSQTYWFQFEPVTWKVLDPDSGLVLCCSAIDAQAYHNYIIYDRYNDEYWGNADPDQKYRANDYAHSDIRAWLNEDFINTAFSTAQQENIKVSELDDASTYGGYDYESSADKIFLLSLTEATNGAYGFDPDQYSDDTARQMSPSDYAQCQGIDAIALNAATKASFWWLREYSGIEVVNGGTPVGIAGSLAADPCVTYLGVVPALRMQELQDDPTGAPLKVAPEMTLTAEPVTYGEDAVITATLAKNAAGTVDFTVTKDAFTATYSANIENGAATVSLPVLDAGAYTVTAEYPGLGNYAAATATATLTVHRKPLNVRVVGPDGPYKQYNGQEQSHTGAVVWIYDRDESGLDDTKLRYTGNTTVKGTNAGRHETALSADDCVCDDSNFDVTFTAQGTICFTIGQSVLDITADSKETNHGDNLAPLTYTINPRFGSYYNESDLGISISTNADKNKPGAYDIIITTQENPNYLINISNGTYTVGNSPHTWGGVTYTWTGTAFVKAERKCVYCDEVETETKATTSQQTKAPTCTANGETTYTAVFENAAFKTQTKTVTDIDALNHDWKTEWSKDGVNHWHDCTRCDEKNDEATHTYGDVSYTWEQTRGAWKATAKRACTVCEWEETETVNATGRETKPATCTANGETTYTAQFENAAFETQQKTVADIAALDHDWKTAWSKDGVHHWHACTRCDAKNAEAAHTYGTVTYTWEQTRGAWKATAKRACTVCEWEETETVNATGAQSKDPTCTVNGETTYSAEFENAAFETQTKTVDDIAALDHAYDAVVTEPTCTEDGYTTHTCSRCGDTYTDSETAALGHAWGEWEIVRTATPNEKGEKIRVCTRCGEVETAEIDELILTSSVDGQTGSSLVVTVPYAKRGMIATTLTADEPVTYTSSNPQLLRVDKDGNVTFARMCIFCKTATVTAVSADGSKVATCKVNIEIKWWQYIIWFFLGSLWF